MAPVPLKKLDTLNLIFGADDSVDEEDEEPIQVIHLT